MVQINKYAAILEWNKSEEDFAICSISPQKKKVKSSVIHTEFIFYAYSMLTYIKFLLRQRK
jgi:hypothetical protein